MTDNPDRTAERLAKRMARSGVASRRDAEKMILAGRVRVGGVLVNTPAFLITPAQVLSVDDRTIPLPERARLWGYYKPVGLVTTHKDPQGRPTVFETLPSKIPHVISIGRLDLNSEGLLLLTSSGELAHYAESPKTAWPRCYRVRVYGTMSDHLFDKIRHGCTIDGVRYGPAQVEFESPTTSRDAGRNQWVNITLHEGKNREIRKLMEYLDLRVNRLIRTSYGPFSLFDTKKPGDIWEFSYSEIKPHFPFLNTP